MHYVFHPHHEAVVVSTAEYQNYLDNGWYDSPLKFPKPEPVKSEEKEIAPLEDKKEVEDKKPVKEVKDVKDVKDKDKAAAKKNAA